MVTRWRALFVLQKVSYFDDIFQLWLWLAKSLFLLGCSNQLMSWIRNWTCTQEDRYMYISVVEEEDKEKEKEHWFWETYITLFFFRSRLILLWAKLLSAKYLHDLSILNAQPTNGASESFSPILGGCSSNILFVRRIFADWLAKYGATLDAALCIRNVCPHQLDSLLLADAIAMLGWDGLFSCCCVFFIFQFDKRNKY